MIGVKCEHCGAEIDILAEYCKYCGESNSKLNYKHTENKEEDIKPVVFSEEPQEEVGVEILAYLAFLIIIPILLLKSDRADNKLRFHTNNGIIILILHTLGYISMFTLNRIGMLYGGEGAGGTGTLLNFFIIPIFILMCIIYIVPLIGCIKVKQWKVPMFGWIKIIKQQEE